MITRALLVAVLLSNVAFAGIPKRLAPTGPAADAKLEGFVLVWHDTTFYVDDKDPSYTIRLGTLKGARANNVDSVVAMRVVGTTGDLVEVEAIADRHCTNSKIITHYVQQLRLFVRRADLAPVVTTAFDKTYPDGTRFQVGPGTPVIARSDKTFVARFAGHEIPVEIPAANVGYAYASATLSTAMPEKKDKLIELRPNAAAKLGKQSFKTGKSGMGEEQWTVTKKGATALVTLDYRCTSAVVSVSAKQLAAAKFDRIAPGSRDEMSAYGGIFGDPPPGTYIPAGTKLQRPSTGRLVAVTRDSLPVPRPSARACIDLEPELFELPKRATTPTDEALYVCAPDATGA